MVNDKDNTVDENLEVILEGKKLVNVFDSIGEPLKLELVENFNSFISQEPNENVYRKMINKLCDALKEYEKTRYLGKISGTSFEFLVAAWLLRNGMEIESYEVTFQKRFGRKEQCCSIDFKLKNGAYVEAKRIEEDDNIEFLKRYADVFKEVRRKIVISGKRIILAVNKKFLEKLEYLSSLNGKLKMLCERAFEKDYARKVFKIIKYWRKELKRIGVYEVLVIYKVGGEIHCDRIYLVDKPKKGGKKNIIYI